MNIAIFADVHGRVLLAFQLCARWGRETGEKIDLILQAGDLGAYPDISRLDSATVKHARRDPSELGFSQYFVTRDDKAETILSQTSASMLFVRGNHEDHLWLDGLEKRVNSAIFPIDAYQRVFCLKTGMPYIHQSVDWSICILGIGRIAPLPGEQDITKSKYIQPYEQERIYDMDIDQLDILLTHDTAQDFLTFGYGMEEIRLVLDSYPPVYHFHGHTEESFIRREDSNGFTQVYKMSDLHWEVSQSRQPLEAGAMGILRWQDRTNHSFEVVDADWIGEYNMSNWLTIS